MNIIVEFRPEERRRARADYRRTDFALQYALRATTATAENGGLRGRVDAALGIRPREWLAIADTLVIVFSGGDAALTAFDAYTNIDLWARTPALELPEVVGVGKVILSRPPSGTDRIDMGVVPVYQYSESNARLRVELRSTRQNVRHYQASDCLVVGVDDDGLASMLLSNLGIE